MQYQLTLKNGLFGFCDDRGSWQFDIATGKQSSGTRHCDIDQEQVQSNCDDSIQIGGTSEGGDDRMMVGNNIVDPGGGDRAVIGSGWVAWSTLDNKKPLRLETLSRALEHTETPK